MRAYIAYYRVSTLKQGVSGLGLDAQKSSVESYLHQSKEKLIAEFTDVESGKGADALNRRPELKKAIELCRSERATLLIAKLDRLARNVHFISGLIESGCDFVAVDMPHATKVMLQIHAVMSEYERDQISSRTKAALGAAKRRGVILGRAGPANLAPSTVERQRNANDFASKLACTVRGYQLVDMTQRQMVNELNRLNLPTPRGGKWSLSQLQRLMARIESLQ